LAAATGKSETQIRAIQSMADRVGVSFGTMNARVDAASAGHGKFAVAANTAAQSISNVANAAAGNGGSGGSGGSLANAADKSNSAFDRLANTLTRRVIFAAVANEARQLAQYIWNLNGAIAATADAAQRSSISGGTFQGLQTAAAYKGVANTDFNTAMVAFNQQVDLAKHGVGDLKALLTGNGKVVGDTATTFGIVADMVKNTTDEARKFSILQQAGLPTSAAFVKYMEQGSTAIKAQGDAATKLSQQQLEDAKRIDAAWQEGWTNFESYGKKAIVSTFSTIGDIWSRGFGPTGKGSQELNGQPLIPGSQGLKKTGYEPMEPAQQPRDITQEKLINSQLQARLSLQAQLGGVDAIVAAKEAELAGATLNLVGPNKALHAALIDVARAQAEMTRVGAQAQIGVFNIADATKAAGDQLKAWTAQGLLDPTNLEQFGAASIAVAKKVQDLSDAAKVAGAPLESLQRLANEAGSVRTQLDQFATTSMTPIAGVLECIDSFMGAV
jgi:hypothetical protein